MTTPLGDQSAASADAPPPSLISVLEIRPGAPTAFPPLDVIVCVHDAAAAAHRCLASILPRLPAEARLLVIDDGSVEPAARALCAGFAAGDPRVVRVRRDAARGYVRAVNAALALTRPAADVLLVTSDVECFDGAIAGLARAAYAGARPALAGPLTNDGTLASVPAWLAANPLPAGLSKAAFADLVRRAAPPARPELFTPVGHALYWPRAILDRVGPLADCFSPGYGEENDLGARARQAGFGVRLADDVFVWHEGAASFGTRARARLRRRAAALMERRHPGFHAGLDAFLRSAPLASVHDRIHAALDAEAPGWRTGPRATSPSSPGAPWRGWARAIRLRLSPAYWARVR